MNYKLILVILGIHLIAVQAYPVEKSSSSDLDKSYDEEEEYVVEIEGDDDDGLEQPVKTNARLTSNNEVRKPKTANFTPLSSNEIDKEEEDDYSTVWGASSVEGSFIRKVLEEEDDIGVSFEQLTRFQQEFGRRLGKSAKPKLLDVSNSGNQIRRVQSSKQINKPSTQPTPRTTSTTTTTTTTTSRTTTTQQTTPTSTTALPSSLTPRSDIRITPTIAISQPTTSAPRPEFSPSIPPAAPAFAPSSAVVDIVPESRDISESVESSSEISEEDYNLTTESFAEIQKISAALEGVQTKQLNDQTITQTNTVSQDKSVPAAPIQETVSLNLEPKIHSVVSLPSNTPAESSQQIGDLTKAVNTEATPIEQDVKEEVTTLNSEAKEDSSNLGDKASSTETSVTEESVTTLATVTTPPHNSGRLSVTTVATAGSVTNAPALAQTESSKTEANGPATTTEATDLLRRIPGRRTSAKRFRLASSTAKSELAEGERPLSVAIRRRPVNPGNKQGLTINQGIEQEKVQGVQIAAEKARANEAKVEISTSLLTDIPRRSIVAVDLKSTQKIEVSTVRSEVPAGIFGQRIRKLKQKA